MLVAVLVIPEQHAIDEVAMLIGPKNAMLNWWYAIDRTRDDCSTDAWTEFSFFVGECEVWDD